MLQLTLCVFLRSALPEVGIKPCNRLTGLGTLNDHAPFVFCKGQHDSQDQIASEGILYQPHIQDVHPHTPVEKLSDRRNPVNCGACEAIQLGDN